MKFLVDIQKDVFTRLFNNDVELSPEDVDVIVTAIRNGIPESQSMYINIDDETKLYAEKNTDNDFAEFMVFIKKQDGTIQDLARVGQDIIYDEEIGDLRKVPEEYYIKVYADETQEDYTDEFIVKEYKENETDKGDEWWQYMNL